MTGIDKIYLFFERHSILYLLGIPVLLAVWFLQGKPRDTAADWCDYCRSIYPDWELSWCMEHCGKQEPSTLETPA